MFFIIIFKLIKYSSFKIVNIMTNTLHYYDLIQLSLLQIIQI